MIGENDVEPDSSGNINTLHCDLRFKLLQGWISGGVLSDSSEHPIKGLPDVNGNIVPWSELATAKDGCEVHQKLGRQDLMCKCPDYNQRFRLIDKDTGDPIPDTYYEITDSNGSLINGRTDENGFTEKVHGKIAESGDIKFYQDEDDQGEL